ncbi:MAG: hypothetical protein SF182_10095, partial [Deltaproteobacteria bacterium]|nr:hypothetical protein [Deltaproteobacteria bacterium]
TVAAAAPFLVLFVAWMGGLIARAWQADPRRARRRRQRALRAAIDAVRVAPDTARRCGALLDWQRLAAQSLALDLAVPTAAQLRQLDDPRWAAVWADSERALYREDHTLAPGWCDGALALLQARGDHAAAAPTPMARPARARFLRRAAATAMLLLGLAALPAQAAEWSDVRGDASSTASAPSDPTDWIARYNLALAAAAAGRSGHALGETVAAFAQAPRQPAVRAAFAERVATQPGSDATLAALAHGAQPASWLAAWQWQMALLTGLAIVAAGGGFGLVRRPRAALAVAAIGLLVAGSAGVALRQYGALVDPRAAVVAQDVALRTLPTDAAPVEGAPRVAAGTLVRAEHDFLGWTAIRCADGSRGWLRRGELVEIYRASRV